MKNPLGGIALLFVILAFAACGTAKDQRVTKDNKDTIFQQIRDSNDLTVEEIELLAAFAIRQGLGRARSGTVRELPVGMTIGEMIDDQLEWTEKTRKHEAREKLRIANARAEEEAQQVTLREVLKVTVFDKDFHTADHQDYITIRVEYENKSGKDIRSFTGILQFNDLFGDEIAPFTISEDTPLRRGEAKRLAWTLKYDQFADRHVKFRNTALDNLKVEWKPQVIVFADGTSMEVKTSS